MKMRKIGIIHTTEATVQSLGQLIRNQIPESQVINILDDSILSDMRDGHKIEYVRERWIDYAKILEKMEVEAVLSACSTVGEFAEEANILLNIPVYRIDEAMAEEAVQKGNKIAVLATLMSTLKPTVTLIRRKAMELKKEIDIETVLVDGAYEQLMQGNREEHNNRIQQAVKARIDHNDVLVLAQASMASALNSLSEGKEKILTSPELGIRKLKKDLGTCD